MHHRRVSAFHENTFQTAALPRTPRQAAPTALQRGGTADAARLVAMTLESLSREIAAVRAELQQLATRMSAQDAVHRRGELEQLRMALEACASAVPTGGAEVCVKETMPRSFLDILPSRALNRVLRFLSERPRNDDWKCYMSGRDATIVFQLGGPLADALGAQCELLEFHAGCVTRPLRIRPFESGVAVLKEHAAVALAAAAATTRLRFVANQNQATPNGGMVAQMINMHIGAFAEVMHLGATQLPMEEETNVMVAQEALPAVEWIDVLRMAGERVVHLELVCLHAHVVEQVLQECGGRLQSLALDWFCSSRTHLRHVARYCRGLRKLSLQAVSELESELWAAIGASLRELEIPMSRLHYPNQAHGPPMQLRHVDQLLAAATPHCTNLSRVVVEVQSRGKALCDLLIACGDRLQFARVNLSRATESMCAAIAAACPAAVFELISIATRCAVRGLRYRVRSMAVSAALVSRAPVPPSVGGVGLMFGIGSMDPLEFCSHVKMLRSLQLVRMREGASAVLDAIISLSKPPLERVVVQAPTESPFGILDALNGGTPRLKVLTMETQELPSQGLDEFVDAHGELEKLLLHTRSSALAFKKVHAIVNAVARLPKLNELRIWADVKPFCVERPILSSHTISQTRNQCMILRARGVSVHIFGIDYYR